MWETTQIKYPEMWDYISVCALINIQKPNHSTEKGDIDMPLSGKYYIDDAVTFSIISIFNVILLTVYSRVIISFFFLSFWCFNASWWKCFVYCELCMYNIFRVLCKPTFRHSLMGGITLICIVSIKKEKLLNCDYNASNQKIEF